jgi:NAD(P)-dependent dehydrogenase (short-subunit alcohol dehydrogenase family)
MNERKVVVVSGASAGIGRACADALHARGHRVYGASRTIEKLAPRPAFELLALDVDDEHQVARAIATVLEREGRIDALVQCAGYAVAGSIEDTSLAEARAQLETNFFGAVSLARAVVPVMRAQRDGVIVNVSSIAGIIPMPFQAYYSASKAALSAFTRALRMEVAPFGVRVATVEPGDHKTEFTARRKLAANAKSDAYGATFARALAVMEKDEQGGSAAEPVGALVARIVEARSPRASYLCGPLVQRLAVGLRSWISERLFEWGLRRYYELDT